MLVVEIKERILTDDYKNRKKNKKNNRFG